MDRKWKVYAKNTFLTMGVIGMSDIILRGVTDGEFKLIRTVLTAVFGE